MAVAQELLELNLCSFLSRISRFDASLDQKKKKGMYHQSQIYVHTTTYIVQNLLRVFAFS
jgi:hypothetical protein